MAETITIELYSKEPIMVHTCHGGRAHITAEIDAEDLFQMLRKMPIEARQLAFEEIGIRTEEESPTTIVEDDQDILGLSLEQKLELAYKELHHKQKRIDELEACPPKSTMVIDNDNNPTLSGNDKPENTESEIKTIKEKVPINDIIIEKTELEKQAKIIEDEIKNKESETNDIKTQKQILKDLKKHIRRANRLVATYNEISAMEGRNTTEKNLSEI